MSAHRMMRGGAIAVLALLVGGSTAIAQRAGTKSASTSDLARQLGVHTLSKGTSSRFDRRKAIDALPLRGLNQQGRSQVDAVLKSVSQYRRLPTLRAQVEPEVYNYFLSHPDVAVSLWRVMRISDFQMTQTAPYRFAADAGDGSRGTADVLYRSNRECLVLCRGIYKNPVLKKPIEARALIHMKFRFQAADAGETPVVTQELTTFISFPSTAIKTVAKVISPVTNMIMDRNALEITVFLKVMSDSMQTRPHWVQGMARQMDGVASERRTELSALAARINTHTKERNVRAHLQKRDRNPMGVLRMTRPGTLRTVSQPNRR